jgi:toxin FitB
VTRFLLDTNIISDATKPAPSRHLAAWFAAQPDATLHVSVLTVAEIDRGIRELPAGRRRRALESWFAGPEGPGKLFAGRILPFDERAAAVWARLMAEGRRAGRPRSALDMIVAATALAHDCTIVTGNERDFVGLPVFNPLRGE